MIPILHWKFWVQDWTMGGIWIAVMPIIACDCINPKSDRAFAATWAAVLECPRPEVIAEAVRPNPAMIAVAQPTPAW
jgi:hypothetical protein